MSMDFLSNIIAVTDRRCCTRDFNTQLERICRVKPVRLILREKDLDDTAYEALLLTALKHCSAYGVPLSVSGRVHIAQKYGTDLHLPCSSFLSLNKDFRLPSAGAAGGAQKTISDSSAPWLPKPCIGVSVHSAMEAADAAMLGADYIIAGHIFATDCKKGVLPRGLDFLKDVCAAVNDACRGSGRPNVPVYGIGGITPDRLPLLLQAGASGGCMMSAAMRL